MKLNEFKSQVLPLKNKMYRYVLSIVGNEQDSQDIVQDVLIKCWEYLKSVDQVDNIEAWCIRVARNRAFDLLKRKGRNTQDISSLYDMSGKEISPLEHTSNNDLHQVIADCLKLLPSQQMEVISLRDYEGYSYKEIAEILNITMSQVKVLIHRARKKLKELLTSVNNYGIIKAS